MYACVPPPLNRIARRTLKARLKTLAGAFGHAPVRRALLQSPQASINRTIRKYSGGPLVFSYTRMRQYSPIGI
jgi:hypothetical protein